MKKYIVIIKKIGDKNYKKIVGYRNSMEKAESLQMLMISKISDDYYLDMEIKENIKAKKWDVQRKKRVSFIPLWSKDTRA